MQYTNRATSAVARKRVRWFRRLLNRIRNRKHRKLKEPQRPVGLEGQAEVEDARYPQTTRPSTSGYDQPGSSYLQNEAQKQRPRHKHRTHSNHKDGTEKIKDLSSKQTEYPGLSPPMHSPARPNKYVAAPSKLETNHQYTPKLTIREKDEYYPSKQIAYPTTRRDSIPLQLELHPIYDLHNVTEIRAHETKDESLKSPHQFLEENPNLSPRVRDSIDRVYAWDIRQGERLDPAILSGEMVKETPAGHGRIVHFDVSVDEPTIDDDFQNVRNQLESEQAERRKRKLQRKRRRGRVKRKLIERFFRPRHYKPLREAAEDKTEIRAIEAEFEQKRFVVSTSPSAAFPYPQPRRSTSKRIRKAAKKSYHQVVSGMESVTLEPTPTQYRTLRHQDGRTVVEATV